MKDTFLDNDNNIFQFRETFITIWKNLSRKRKRQVCFVLFLMLISATSEIISLGSILPFLAALSNPNLLWRNTYIQKMSTFFGVQDSSQLLFLFTLIFIITILICSIIRLINIWANQFLGALIGTDLSCEAYRRTLHQPYQFHVKVNSSDITAIIIKSTQRSTDAIKAFLNLITSLLVTIFIVLALLIINFKIAITAAGIFGIAYLLIAIFTKKELRNLSFSIKQSEMKVFRALSEGLGAIRDVLLEGNQSIYLDRYVKADLNSRIKEAKSMFLQTSPRYSLEGLGTILLAVLGYMLTLQSGQFSNIIPSLGLIALGSQKLLPASQQIYSSWALIMKSQADLLNIIKLISQPYSRTNKNSKFKQINADIELYDVNFTYLKESQEIIKGINLKIKSGEIIGLVGKTGSGKSTLIDILMTLLEPTSGDFKINGRKVNYLKDKNYISQWKSGIAHVPQFIYLADCSIAENIAFGVPSELIDINRVRKAAQAAQASEFIDELSKGYQTFVGERGIRLSGGQRQRIGIARALYKKSNLLIFDEATSALDNLTEQNVIKSIVGLKEGQTIIMIAHRLTTLRSCDRIISLEKGQIIEDGTPLNVLGIK